MSRYQCKNTITNTQDNMTPPEPSNYTKAGPKKCNLAEAQDKDFKITAMNMFKDLKVDMNKPPNEVFENSKKEWDKMIKIVQDMELIIESLFPKLSKNWKRKM